ncbi:TorD/DmsD family molecular chaperone [Ideonella paludis]|uniref:Molecular chaperone TorD family protein n=1 Tax=Ideonella paludis TaxID=1233411 RepID=A0ABS5E1T0_9BURK|nr:molecular chaperone TorD family protein [Ideonella paludis]MBQ0937373.1 molecular chaperone TorD family protein [Ideonella paludis]
MTASQALSFATADQAEEGARAELYGVLALLWLAPPSDELLAQFRVAVTEAPEAGAFLQGPWEALVGALRSTTVAQAQDEFDALFGGVGKPDVLVYGSHYLAGFLNEKPLALLRQDMAQLGLQGDAQSGQTEDHIAGVFEVMRYLIAGDDVAVCNLEQQRRFFRTHVQPWVEQLCNAVDAHPRAQLWRAVADMTRAFVQVETQGFDLVE